MVIQILGKNWNVFRYTADLSHLASILILLTRMIRKRSCHGISLKTHILYLIVFLCRYCPDGFFRPPLYNIFFKIVYIVLTSVIIVLIRFVYRKTYDRKHDTFHMWFILLVCVPPTLLSALNWGLSELLWTYSLWLESLVIFPQLFMLRRTQRTDTLTKDYIFFLGSYRLFYILNWARKYLKKHKTETVVWITGIIQTLVYIDFLYYYVKAFVKGTEMELPR
jgi:ER lumen protein retaining receptor